MDRPNLIIVQSQACFLGAFPSSSTNPYMLAFIASCHKCMSIQMDGRLLEPILGYFMSNPQRTQMTSSLQRMKMSKDRMYFIMCYTSSYQIITIYPKHVWTIPKILLGFRHKPLHPLVVWYFLGTPGMPNSLQCQHTKMPLK